MRCIADRCGGIPGDVGLMSDRKDERIRKERQSDAVVKGHGPVEAADANSNKKSYCTPTRLFTSGTFVFVTSCKKITIITIITIITTYNADHCLLFAVPEGNICNALFRIMYLTKCI